MPHSRRRALTAITGAALACTLVASAAQASPSATTGDHDEAGWTFAAIGDIPYGAAQYTRFPDVVAQINADRDVRLVTHLGDIKNGRDRCDEDYYRSIRSTFDTFADPLVYTPGDNEWSDCHFDSTGNFNPLERLEKVRSIFFDSPGKTLGKSVGVRSQNRRGLPENVRFDRADVAFAAIHVVSGNNSLNPWVGLGQTSPTPEQVAEVQMRTAGDVALIEQVFREASDSRARAVVLLTQADMFDPFDPAPTLTTRTGFQPIVRAIAEGSAGFAGPVYLINGDSHVYNVAHPLATGSPWLDLYQVPAPAGNLTQITVDGSTALNNWLKVTVHDQGPETLTWERVPFLP